MSKVYVICDNDCKYESMTKEDILAAIAEATGVEPSGDVVFSKIKELNANGSLEFWKGTETQFNALGVTATENVIRVDGNGRVYLVPAGAFVLPDGSVTREKIAEGAAAVPSVSQTITLSGWSDNSCTVSVAGVKSASNVIVTPHPDSFIAWAESMIRATGQSDGYLTFACEDVPSGDVKANILIVG